MKLGGAVHKFGKSLNTDLNEVKLTVRLTQAAAGNARVQEFYVTTPPAKLGSISPSRGSRTKDDAESPWRIRLTVQAECLDDSDSSLVPMRLAETTTTSKIPLKGGEDDSVVVKRGRGRPRKSLDSPVKRNGTPKPKTAGRRKTMPEKEIEQSWAPTPPMKRATKGMKYMELGEDLSSLTVRTSASPLQSPARRTPERTIKARPFSRTKSRSRNRRQEITPKKITGFEVQGNEDSLRATPNIQDFQMEDGDTQSELTEPQQSSLNHSTSEQELNVDGEGESASSLERSTLDVEDENMWRSMIRQHSVSPVPGCGPLMKEQASKDPTEDYPECDTILESEGFSMVSVDSLSSTGRLEDTNQQSNPLDNTETTPSRAHVAMSPSSLPHGQGKAHANEVTPSKYGNAPCQKTQLTASKHIEDFRTPEADPVLPQVPPNLQPPIFHENGRAVNEPTDGTPKLERVARAGAALQAVPSPQESTSRGQLGTLASPFSNSKKPSAASKDMSTLSQSRSSPESENSQMANAFDGFSAATRRELRAGLRLGQELAKREHPSLSEHDNNNMVPSQTSSSFVCPRLPGAPGAVEFEQASTQKAVSYPFLIKVQLPTPSPDVSDTDEGGGKTFSKTELRAERPGHSVFASHDSAADNVDYTMLAKEAEWQREREAVSKQIREANASQVIVINSDIEYSSQDHYSGELEVSSQKDLPGHRQTVDETSPSALPRPTIAQHRRSKLPSPWRRQTGGVYTDELEPTASDLFWQPDLAQSEAAKKRQERKKQRELSHTSSQMIATKKDTRSESASVVAAPRIKTPQTVWMLPASTENQYKSTVSYEEEENDEEEEIEEVESVSEDPEKLTEACTQPSDESQAGEASVSLAPDESAASVPLPGTPPLGPIDPALIPRPKEPQPSAKQIPMQRSQAAQPSTSWLSALTAPLTALFVSAPKFPYPPATLEDILESSPYEPLTLHQPWTPAHSRALTPIYQASTLYTPEIFPYNSRSMSAYLLGATITSGNGWQRKMTKGDCGVIDAFLTILRHRGIIPKRELRHEEHLGTREMAMQILKLWTIMIMNGEVKLSDYKGAKAGMRIQMDRKWREEDINWVANRSQYFERKRAEFERRGLPSWQEQGLVGPFKLS